LTTLSLTKTASIFITFLRSIQHWNLVSNHSIDSRSEKTTAPSEPSTYFTRCWRF